MNLYYKAVKPKLQILTDDGDQLYSADVVFVSNPYNLSVN